MESKEPKVGIIIPSYNQGKYIEKALQSIIANKQHANISIAVMDGGSQDKTLSIITKYEKEIDVWCSEPDGGQAAAINKGIHALPDCKYYLWLNSDDLYESEFAVKQIVEYAERGNFQVCYGLSHFVDEQGQILGEYPVERFDRIALGNRCYLSQPSVMFSRRAYEEIGPLSEQLKMCLDYEYWIRLAQQYEFGFLEEYIGATRMYGETKTATMQQRHLEEAIAILIKYYGRVPMHWIVTKVLADHPNKLLELIPKRVLMWVMRPWKSHVIRQVLEGNDNAKDIV